MEDDIETLTNMKFILYIYEKMSGLKINFGKSEIIMVSSEEQKALHYSKMINCATAPWSIKYLGVLVSGSKLHVKDWIALNEKILKRLDGWQCASLSYGGKLIFVECMLKLYPNLCHVYVDVAKNCDKKIDTRKRFFWQGGTTKRKYHLVKWAVISKPKKKGGLGVKDPRKMNISLLCKWWWKVENGEGLWQETIRKNTI
jgi:hypothetical protein